MDITNINIKNCSVSCFIAKCLPHKLLFDFLLALLVLLIHQLDVLHCFVVSELHHRLPLHALPIFLNYSVGCMQVLCFHIHNFPTIKHDVQQNMLLYDLQVLDISHYCAFWPRSYEILDYWSESFITL